MSILLRGDTVEEKIDGIVRIGQEMNKKLPDHGAFLSTKKNKRNAIGHLREKKVQDGDEQHVEDLAFFFRTLVDVKTCRVVFEIRDELVHIALVGLAHCS